MKLSPQATVEGDGYQFVGAEQPPPVGSGSGVDVTCVEHETEVLQLAFAVQDQTTQSLTRRPRDCLPLVHPLLEQTQ